MAVLEHRWQVPHDLPALAGHFPGQPIVPGVVLLDRVVWLAQQQREASGGTWSATQAKFLSPCGPGDELLFTVQATASGALSFKVRCGVRDVAVGSLVLGGA